MKKTKTQVISELTQQLLEKDELLSGNETKIKNLQTNLQKTSKSRDKWKKLHTDKQEALKRAYQADLKSAKTIEDLEQKVTPNSRLAKWLYDISYKLDEKILKVQKFFEKTWSRNK